jgi:sporulation protein YlmC with PRC-barrel domain
MLTKDTLDTLRGATVVDEDGDKIGTLDEIYLDEDTGQPEWAAVKTGLFGTGLSFVPLASAERDGDELRVPFTKETVKDAPRVEA